MAALEIEVLPSLAPAIDKLILEGLNIASLYSKACDQCTAQFMEVLGVQGRASPCRRRHRWRSGADELVCRPVSADHSG